MTHTSYPTVIKITKDNWEPGISDGLTLSCGICNRVPPFDYKVDDDFWNMVVGEPYKRGVLCLSCLDKLSHAKEHDLSTHLEFVQFTGIGKTIELKPTRIFQYHSSPTSTKGEDS